MKCLTFLILLVLLNACSYLDPNANVEYLNLAPADAKVKSLKNIQAFERFYDQLDESSLEKNLTAAYAESLYFNDTVTTIHERKNLLNYMRHTQQQLKGVQFEVLSVQQQGRDAFVRWNMHTQFRVLGQDNNVQSIGISHLRFNADNKIILHQDYWDSMQGFYQHIPVIGGILQWIKSKLNDY
ncbi:MAG: nuclear transport factor 2 family protein [Methylococcales bacterium]